MSGYVETDEWLLVCLAQTGDMDAFAEIYRRYTAKVFVFVLTRVRDPYLAEDLTSETFCKALRKIDSVTYEGTGVCSWLITIARNLILDHVKSARYKLESNVEVPDFCDEGDDPEQAAIKVIAAAEIKVLVSELLGQLRPSRRRCLELRFFREMTHAETAATMNIKESVSKTWQRKALKELSMIARSST